MYQNNIVVSMFLGQKTEKYAENLSDFAGKTVGKRKVKTYSQGKMIFAKCGVGCSENLTAEAFLMMRQMPIVRMRA